ncbi:hypothetical protein ABT124_00285 [Streptomyces sp. NPDC001982]|uniref:hypothetical protein n=1 Tax=unclassified Streptomyces TaxID=2593676 RepID=UPI0033286919
MKFAPLDGVDRAEVAGGVGLFQHRRRAVAAKGPLDLGGQPGQGVRQEGARRSSSASSTDQSRNSARRTSSGIVVFRTRAALPTDGRRDVLVIPPETDADAAAQLMAGDGIDAPAREEAADRIDVRIREEAWETDGGAGRPSSLPRPIGSTGPSLAGRRR